MSNLINSVYKSQLQSAINDVHDTFMRSITAFQEKKTLVLATSDSYARAYRSNKAATSESIVETSINARIYYPKDRKLENLDLTNDDNVNLEKADADVRIKVALADLDKITSSEIIKIDGVSYKNNSSPRPHGVIDVQYYSFFLKEVQ